MSEEEAVVEERRMVAIIIKPCEGVDPEGLYKVRRCLTAGTSCHLSASLLAGVVDHR